MPGSIVYKPALMYLFLGASNSPPACDGNTRIQVFDYRIEGQNIVGKLSACFVRTFDALPIVDERLRLFVDYRKRIAIKLGGQRLFRGPVERDVEVQLIGYLCFRHDNADGAIFPVTFPAIIDKC